MVMICIENMSDDTYRALEARAKLHSRSVEAEVCAILESAIRLEPRIGMGDALAALGGKIRLIKGDL